jgi:hypothetical protein
MPHRRLTKSLCRFSRLVDSLHLTSSDFGWATRLPASLMNRYFGFLLLLCICGLPACWNAEEKAAIAKLKPTKDPVQEEIYAFRLKMRALYNNRRFSELEPVAAEIRQTKPLFGNGSWKIAQFYESFACRHEEPESMWQRMIAFTRTGSRNFQHRLQRALRMRTFLESTHGTPAALVSPTR